MSEYHSDRDTFTAAGSTAIGTNRGPTNVDPYDIAEAAGQAGIRVCGGEDHGYCCPDGIYVEQPDGNAVHRDDVTAYVRLGERR